MALPVHQFPSVDVTPPTPHTHSFITDDNTSGTSDIRSAVNKIFRDVTQHRMVVPYRRCVSFLVSPPGAQIIQEAIPEN